MGEKEMETSSRETENLDPALKLALALAIVQSKRRQNLPNSSTAPPNFTDAHSDSMPFSYSDALRWKKKAKQRKQEILKLREDLKIAEEEVQHGVYPRSMPCKCYFYDDLQQLNHAVESDSARFSDVFRRGFLQQVRWSESRKRRRDCPPSQNSSDCFDGNEVELLRTSADLLVNLCETCSRFKVEDGNFKSLSHEATDFILATLKSISLNGMMDDSIQSIVSSLVVRLVRSMCNGAQGHESLSCQSNLQFCVQHVVRKLGSDPNVGQHIILSVSQEIPIAVESLLSVHPFDAAFLKTHHCLYLMIQLMDFLISDYLLSWPISPNFDSNLLVEWVASVAAARKSLALLENRNSLYMLYMDRVTGELTRNLGKAPFIEILGHDFVKIFSQ